MAFGITRLMGLVAIALLALTSNAAAQIERADELLARAKSFAAAPETAHDALPLFDKAAAIYKAANNTEKYNETEHHHGSALRTLANREMQKKDRVRALDFADRALLKFKALGKHLEEAYVAHDLAFYADQSGYRKESVEYYKLADIEYRLAGNPDGRATVNRNIGLIRLDEKNYAEASTYFLAAIAIRKEMGDVPGEAYLHHDLGDTALNQKKFPDAQASYETALKTFREIKDGIGEAATLFKIAGLQFTSFRFQDTVQTLSSALKIYETVKDLAGETYAVELMGISYNRLGDYYRAEPFLIRAADGYVAQNDVEREGWASLALAGNFQSIRRLDDARAAIARGLAAFRKAKHTTGEGYVLLFEAEVLSYESKHDAALANIKAAEKAMAADARWEPKHGLAQAYSSYHQVLSNYGEAIRYATMALEMAEKEKNLENMTTGYINISNLYSSLGQRQKSVDYTRKAVELAQRTGNKFSEAISLSNLGYELMLMGNYAESEPNYKKAIEQMRLYKFNRELGYAQHNLGLLYFRKGLLDLAETNYNDALRLYLQTGDRRPEAFLYESYGDLYRERGQYQKAVEYLQKALTLSREIRFREVEARSLNTMMSVWLKQKQPRLAILYGKQAVNIFQTIRAGNRTLDTAAKKSFVESNEAVYRALANILIDEGRLAEAQQVLDLLKAEEYFEFVRRDSAEATDQAVLALTESERKALEEYSRVSTNLTALGTSFQVLQDKRNRAGGNLPETEEAEYVRLKAQVETAGEGMRMFFAKLSAEFSKKVEDGTVVTPQSIETLKADLRRAGNDVVLVSTYLLPERYRAIVTTGRTMVDRKVEYSAVKLTGADINRKIFEFQRALQNPGVDPRKIGKELYDIFVKPLEEDLRSAGAKTILWSLDGSLRYIPMAALSPDGKTYLADKYQNVVVTLGRQTNLFTKPSTDEWRAIGAGVSKQHAGFSPLPSVPEEIGSIVRDQKATAGVLDGTKMLDEQFNLESLRDTMPQQTEDGKPFNVLHLATHFSLGANDQDSALLLGDGKRLSLYEIGRDEALDFKDVELLTLSACQTGVSTGDANGREVESLGMLAQKKGAKAVLATLWKVADESTALFMAEFYRIKKADPKINKAEAIRLAQKQMIDGRIKSSGRSNTCRADEFTGGAKQNEFKCDPNAPYSHPYFWSPFVLIGNWR